MRYCQAAAFIFLTVVYRKPFTVLIKSLVDDLAFFMQHFHIHLVSLRFSY
jgi:hypothetical protein